MAGVYSQRHFLGSITGTGDLFTVPSGELWIVRNICTRNFSATAGKCKFGIKVSGADNFCMVTPTLAQDEAHFYDGRVVLNAGDIFRSAVTTGTFSVQISGYKFTV